MTWPALVHIRDYSHSSTHVKAYHTVHMATISFPTGKLMVLLEMSITSEGVFKEGGGTFKGCMDILKEGNHKFKTV